VQLNLSTESFEAGYFYDALTRASQKILISRPRLTESGADWQPSPYWQEILRLIDAGSIDFVSDSIPDAAQIASTSEAVYHSASHHLPGLTEWVQETYPDRWMNLSHASKLFTIHLQHTDTNQNIYEGDLTPYGYLFKRLYDSDHTWSASRLESYGICPFLFFTNHVLHLESREIPELGYDARQLGNIYHHIFEALYNETDNTSDMDQLLDMLPTVATRILDEAPQREQFRITAWWTHSRQEIVENVRKSLVALQQLPGSFMPYAHEKAFGLNQVPPLIVRDGDDYFCLRGYIDRVDRAQDGTIRIIDYKTSGPADFAASAVMKGKKIQLPLYALAASEVLGLGEPVEGFYWHVRDAQPSKFSLKKSGPQKAIQVSTDAAWKMIRAIRNGAFSPHPPLRGCPSYCPAAGFCWQYRSGYVT
jgi:ATP-dependent helicase/DNAse subunit B